MTRRRLWLTPVVDPTEHSALPCPAHLARNASGARVGTTGPLNQLLGAAVMFRASQTVREKSRLMSRLTFATTTPTTFAGVMAGPRGSRRRRHRSVQTAWSHDSRRMVQSSCCSSEPPGLQARSSSASSTATVQGGGATLPGPATAAQRRESQSAAGATLGHERKRCSAVSRL